MKDPMSPGFDDLCELAAAVGAGAGWRVGAPLAVGEAAGRTAGAWPGGEAAGRAAGVNVGKIAAFGAPGGSAVTGAGVQIAADGAAGRSSRAPTKTAPIARTNVANNRHRDFTVYTLPEQAAVSLSFRECAGRRVGQRPLPAGSLRPRRSIAQDGAASYPIHPGPTVLRTNRRRT